MKRVLIYKETAEISYKTPLLEAVETASLNSSNDTSRKIVAEFSSFDEAHEFLKAHPAQTIGYEHRYSNRVYSVELFNAYEEEFDSEVIDEWFPTGNEEHAQLDPKEIEYWQKKENEE